MQSTAVSQAGGRQAGRQTVRQTEKYTHTHTHTHTHTDIRSTQTGWGNFSLVNNHYETASHGALASLRSAWWQVCPGNLPTHTHLPAHSYFSRLSSLPPLLLPPPPLLIIFTGPRALLVGVPPPTSSPPLPLPGRAGVWWVPGSSTGLHRCLFLTKANRWRGREREKERERERVRDTLVGCCTVWQQGLTYRSSFFFFVLHLNVLPLITVCQYNTLLDDGVFSV